MKLPACYIWKASWPLKPLKTCFRFEKKFSRSKFSVRAAVHPNRMDLQARFFHLKNLLCLDIVGTKKYATNFELRIWNVSVSLSISAVTDSHLLGRIASTAVNNFSGKIWTFNFWFRSQCVLEEAGAAVRNHGAPTRTSESAKLFGSVKKCI